MKSGMGVFFIKKREKSVGRRRKGKASIVSRQQNVSEKDVFNPGQAKWEWRAID